MKKLIVILLTISFLLTGCGEKDNGLLGDWYYIEDEVAFKISFNKNDKCEIVEDASKEGQSCTYKVNSDEITIKFDGEETKVKYNKKDNYIEINGIKFYNSMDAAKENIKENTIVIPDVKGMTLTEATKKLEEAGLKVGLVTRKYDSNIEEGRVIETLPGAGRRVGKLEEVGIFVSNGEEPELIEDAEIEETE